MVIKREWGRVARKGATTLRWSDEEWEAHGDREPPRSNQTIASDRWERIDERTKPKARRDVSRARRVSERALPAEVAAAIRKAAVGFTNYQRERLVERMTQAVTAYDRGRFLEAYRMSKDLSAQLPEVSAIRRVAGFSAYRMGRWREAIRHFEAYDPFAEDGEHLPALMDSLRAIGKRRVVMERWEDVRQRAGDPDVVAEARMVVAGTLADDSKIADAIELLMLAGAGKAVRNPAGRHLRQWYAIGDLYDRGGDVAGARQYFMRVYAVDPQAYDVADRLEAIGVLKGKSRRGPRQRSVAERSVSPGTDR